MSAAISLRDNYDGAQLRALAKASKDANQTRRLLCLAMIYEGGSRGEAAAPGGVGLQIIRDLVLRFNVSKEDFSLTDEQVAQREKSEQAAREHAELHHQHDLRVQQLKDQKHDDDHQHDHGHDHQH